MYLQAAATVHVCPLSDGGDLTHAVTPFNHLASIMPSRLHALPRVSRAAKRVKGGKKGGGEKKSGGGSSSGPKSYKSPGQVKEG